MLNLTFLSMINHCLSKKTIDSGQHSGEKQDIRNRTRNCLLSFLLWGTNSEPITTHQDR